MNTKKAITFNTVTVSKLHESVLVSESNGRTHSSLGNYRDLKDAFEEILTKHQLNPRLRDDLTKFQEIAEDADWDFDATRKAVMRLELEEDERDSNPELQ